MKIAIPTAQGKLCQHFGHCEKFAIISVDQNKDISDEIYETPPPHEPGVLPAWLAEKKVDVIISGGMGMRAQNMFIENNIEVVTGVMPESPKDVVVKYLNGTLESGSNLCDH